MEIKADIWVRKPSLPGYGFSLAVLDNKLVCFGGDSKSILSLSENDSEWTCVEGCKQNISSFCYHVVDEDALYIFLGDDDDKRSVFAKCKDDNGQASKIKLLETKLERNTDMVSCAVITLRTGQ